MLNVLLPNCEQDSFMFQHIEQHAAQSKTKTVGEGERVRGMGMGSKGRGRELWLLMTVSLPWPSSILVFVFVCVSDRAVISTWTAACERLLCLISSRTMSSPRCHQPILLPSSTLQLSLSARIQIQPMRRMINEI